MTPTPTPPSGELPDEPKLLPCPFCGSAATERRSILYNVGCAACKVYMRPVDWNRRAHLAAGSGEGWVSVETLFKKATGYTVDEYREMVADVKNESTNRQSVPAASGTQEGEAICEVTAIRAPVTEGSVAPVSPAISLAVSPASHREKPIIEVQGSQSSNQSGNGNTKPNCYKCKHRRDADGSSHSRCGHPLIGELGQFAELAFLVKGIRGPAMKRMNVSGDAHGIRSGWFMWPLNYDPIWLETCEGYEPLPPAPQEKK